MEQRREGDRRERGREGEVLPHSCGERNREKERAREYEISEMGERARKRAGERARDRERERERGI